MRESCSCGASIRARYKRVIEWRKVHLHTDEPIPSGSEADTMIAEPRAFDSESSEAANPVINAKTEHRLGFQPNGRSDTLPLR